MLKRPLLCLLALPLSAQCLLAESGRHSIAIASEGDSFLVASASVTSSATLFSGDSVQAGNTDCRVLFNNGQQLLLKPHSSAKVYDDRIILEGGRAETNLQDAVKVETKNFVLRPVTAKAEAVVEVSSDGMAVAMLSGQAEVLNHQGAVVSEMATGASLKFTPVGQDGPAPRASTEVDSQIRVLGVVNVEDHHYLIRDRFTNTVSELVGDVPPKLVNDLAMIDGVVESESSSIPHVDRMLRIVDIRRSGAASGVPCVPDGTGGVAKRVNVKGTLRADGQHYLVTEPHRGTYELVGDVDNAQLGKEVNIKGFYLQNRKGSSPAERVVYAERRRLEALDSPCLTLSATGVLVTAIVLADLNYVDAAGKTPVSF